MKALRVAVCAALVAGWVGAAWLLAGTVVPDDLALPHVDVDQVFGADLVARAERYERFLLILWLLGLVVSLATLAVYARHGARFAEESAAGLLGTGMLLGMLGLAIVWLTQLPFTVVALWWSRRHDVSQMGYFAAVFGDWLAAGLGGRKVDLAISGVVDVMLAFPGFLLALAIVATLGPSLENAMIAIAPHSFLTRALSCASPGRSTEPNTNSVLRFDAGSTPAAR